MNNESFLLLSLKIQLFIQCATVNMICYRKIQQKKLRCNDKLHIPSDLNWHLKCVIINLKYNENVFDLLTILYINHQITTNTDVERHKNEATNLGERFP